MGEDYTPSTDLRERSFSRFGFLFVSRAWHRPVLGVSCPEVLKTTEVRPQFSVLFLDED